MSFAQNTQQTWDSYWKLRQAYEGGEVPCFDPECDGTAEPERDGEHAYYECTTCGSSFGYEKVPDAQDDTCSIGVPEEVRRAASGVEPQAVSVQIGRKPQ